MGGCGDGVVIVMLRVERGEQELSMCMYVLTRHRPHQSPTHVHSISLSPTVALLGISQLRFEGGQRLVRGGT